MLTIICLILTIIGGLNWLAVGLFDYNLVSQLFAGELYFIARIIYSLVGFAAIWVTIYLIRHFKAIAHSKNKDK